MTGTPRRIGYVFTALWEGGLERFTLDLIDAMDRNEFEPHVYVLTPQNPWISQFTDRGIDVRVFQGHNKPSLRSALPLARAFGELVLSMRRDHIDLVHTCDFLPATMGRLASRLAGVPRRVHTLHSLYDWYPGWARRINGILARGTDVITAVSASAAQAAADAEGIPLERIRVVLNGANTTRFRPLPQVRSSVRTELGIAETDILVGSVGSITTRKAHHLLVEALAPLIASDPRIHAVIFGAANGGPQDHASFVLERIRALGLEDRVRIHSPRPDVERLFSAFDVHCMPSVVEGLSLASVEAQLCGSLSVFSDIGPFREVVRDGENGLLFRSGDIGNLRSVLERAISLPRAESDRLRTAAREDALRRFDKTRMTESYLDIYRTLLAEGHP